MVYVEEEGTTNHIEQETIRASSSNTRVSFFIMSLGVVASDSSILVHNFSFRIRIAIVVEVRWFVWPGPMVSDKICLTQISPRWLFVSAVVGSTVK